MEIEYPCGIKVKLVNVSPETYPEGFSREHIIAAAARTSFDNFDREKSYDDDVRLIRRLRKDGHTSPFEMASVMFQIKAPKFVTIQLLRHRTMSFNEESQRYHKVKEEFFKPSCDEEFIRLQDSVNKQSSVKGEVSDELLLTVREAEEAVEIIFELYNRMIELGMARECARFCLPMATFSTIVINVDLHNLMKFLRLRLADDAQYETRLVAQGMLELARRMFPISLEDF